MVGFIYNKSMRCHVNFNKFVNKVSNYYINELGRVGYHKVINISILEAVLLCKVNAVGTNSL